jgi:hypothetical protein
MDTTQTNNEAFEIGYTKKDANYFIEKGLHKALVYKVLTKLAYIKNNDACYKLLHGNISIIDIDDLFQECALSLLTYPPIVDDDGNIVEIDKRVFSSITSLIYKQKTRNCKHLYLDTQYGEIDLYNSNLLSVGSGFNEFIESEYTQSIVKAMKTRLNDNDIKVLELRLKGYKATECEKALNLSRSKVRTSLKHISNAYNSVIE